MNSALLRLACASLVLLGLMVAPRWLDTYWVEIGFRFMLFLVLAEAWNLMAGYGGLVSLGSSSFFGVGAYVCVGLTLAGATSLPALMLAAATAGAAIALVVSRAIFRLRGLYFTVGTLALAEALRLFVINVPWFGGATGLFVTTDLPDITVLFRYAAGLVMLSALVMEVCTRSRLSVLLRAVRDDEDAATQMGVRAFRIKLAAFVMASALIAAAGSLQALKLGAIEPYGSFGLQWSVDALTIVIIGGLGLRYGAFVGAGFVIALSEALADYPELHIAVTGAILILVIRFAPHGLCGLFTALLKRRNEPRAVAEIKP